MQRVAVIGSGISGMAAAYLLSPSFDVTLYEKNDYLGGHARTRVAEGTPVDTGFIVFNRVNYPELVGLFEHLGVAVEKSDMSFSFMQGNGAFEWGAGNLNAVFGQRANIFRPSFYRLIWDILTFFKHAPGYVEADAGMTLADMLDELRLGAWFQERFLLPMGAAIWSCSPAQILEFPARTFIRFFQNHGLLSLNGQHQWYTVSGGSREYVKRLTASLAGSIRLSSPVERVWREEEKTVVREKSGAEERYDHVVFASHADETLAMLADATTKEKEVLGAFKYQENHAYLHNDVHVMPRNKRCWASWVYASQTTQDQTKLSVTYWMNRLQNLDPKKLLLVTLNPLHTIAPEHVFESHVFAHPVFTREAIAAQEKIPSIQGVRNLWFCGAYQRYGFHEDGLMSAVAVAEKMGAHIPWH